jgi:two-component system NtrC family sensor kinase
VVPSEQSLDHDGRTRVGRRLHEPVEPAISLVLLTVLLIAPLLDLLVPLPAPVDAASRIAAALAAVLFVARQGLLLRERTTMLAEVRALQAEDERLRQQLISSTRMAAVGALAAGVAHEVNNPLTVILGPAEMLLQDLEPGDPRRQDVQTIREAALRARSVVRALNDFARPSTPQLAPTDLADLVRRTTDLIRSPLAATRVMITESHAELSLIDLDPQAIQQVILNVLTNALQAMPDGGSLQIGSSIRGSEAVVTITDDGVGMDETVAAQAFVPFFSARRGAGALGLGLSVSHGLIESHGGTIRLTSTEGVGTTVEIALPLPAIDRADRAIVATVAPA